MSKVALYHCNSFEQVPDVLDSIIDSLGRESISQLFRNKQVLVKPNICIDHPPEKGATTHPALIDAIISLGKDFGANIIVGDGPIVGVKGKVFNKTGVAQVCKKHDVPLVNFNSEKGKVVRSDNPLAFREALIANSYFEADTIVNLPIFKSNTLYWLSAALKNMKGFLVGKEKHKPHSIDVPKCVADLNKMLRQDLVIMDGLIGMMGDGPAAGKPANAKLLIGSFDPLAVDAVTAKLMGFPLDKIPMLKWAEQVGVGTTNYKITGDPIQSFDLDFEKPRIAKNRIIGNVIDVVSKYAFPLSIMKSKVVIDLQKCNLCCRCIDACPFDAIELKDKTIEINMSKCDICLCCHEACANEAVFIKGLLSRTDAFLRGKIA